MDQDPDGYVDISHLDLDRPSPIRAQEPANSTPPTGSRRTSPTVVEIHDSDDESPDGPTSPVRVPTPVFSTIPPRKVPVVPKAVQKHVLHEVCAPSSFGANPYMEKFQDAQLSSLDILLIDLNKANKTGNALKTSIPPGIVHNMINRSETVARELKKVAKRLAVYRKGTNYKTMLRFDDVIQNDRVVQLAVAHAKFATADPKDYIDLMGRNTYKGRADNITILVDRMDVAVKELGVLRASLINLSDYADDVNSRAPPPRGKRGRDGARPSTRKKRRTRSSPSPESDELFEGASRATGHRAAKDPTKSEARGLFVSDDSDDHDDIDLDLQ